MQHWGDVGGEKKLVYNEYIHYERNLDNFRERKRVAQRTGYLESYICEAAYEKFNELGDLWALRGFDMFFEN